MKNILIIVVVLAVAIFGYQKFQKKSSIIDNANNSAPTSQATTMTLEEVDNIPHSYNDNDTAESAAVNANAASAKAAASKFSCDGRKHCSQMTSCAEATYFLQHCPNTQMDGNGDGIPCEKQWCK